MSQSAEYQPLEVFGRVATGDHGTTSPDALTDPLPPWYAPHEHDVITMPTSEPLPCWDAQNDDEFHPCWAWGEQAAGLRAQRVVLLDVLAWATSQLDEPTSAFFDRCLLACDTVLTSIDDVVGSATAIEHSLTPSHALVRYLDAVLTWLLAVIGELRALLVRATTTDARMFDELIALARYSSVFLEDHLERFRARALAEPIECVRADEARLHDDIVWLHCELSLVDG